MVIIKRFDRHFEAHVWKEKLEANDIPCYLEDENVASAMPVWNMAMGGIKLLVDEQDQERAMVLIQEAEAAYTQSLQCPGCKKASMEFIPQKSTTNFFSAMLTWLFASYAVVPSYIYKCPQCGLELENMPVSDIKM